MDVNVIENITIEMKIVTNAMELIMAKFGSDLDENYTILSENNCREVHKELYSYDFLLKQILKSLCSLRERYKEQIDLHYSSRSALLCRQKKSDW